MAKKKEQEPAGSRFGSFLGRTISRVLTSASEPTTELDPASMQRALSRAAIPRKVKELQAQLDQLRKQVRGRFAGKKDGLRFYIRVAKRAAIESGDMTYSQASIAASVDRLLAKEKTSFSKVCPDSWQKHNPPRLFADVFRIPHHPLRKLAKPYITKTKV